MKVFLSETAEKKFIQISQFILETWGKRVQNNFLKKMDAKIEQISLQPESWPRSIVIPYLYRCVITKQSTFYYRI